MGLPDQQVLSDQLLMFMVTLICSFLPAVFVDMQHVLVRTVNCFIASWHILVADFF